MGWVIAVTFKLTPGRCLFGVAIPQGECGN